MSHGSDISFDVYEPLAIQLAALIDQLRIEGQAGTWTSDSGALSDYESSFGEADEVKSESNVSLVTFHRDESQHKVDLDPGVTASTGLVSDKTLPDENSFLKTDAETITPLLLSDESDTTPSKKKQELNTPEKVGDFLSRIKSKYQEDSSLHSKMELTVEQEQEDSHSNSSEIIMVTDLEKELFSDSSEDISPNKCKGESTGKQRENVDEHKKFESQRASTSDRCYKERSFDSTERVPRDRRGDYRWQRDGEQNNTYSTYRSTGRHYCRGGRGRFSNYRPKTRGGFGTQNRYKTKENRNTGEFENGQWIPAKPERIEPRVWTSRKKEEKLAGKAERIEPRAKKQEENSEGKPERVEPRVWTARKQEEKLAERVEPRARKQEENLPKAKEDKSTVDENHNKLGPEYVEERKAKHGVISHQPSPLVVHSQNMWSSNLKTIKSSTKSKQHRDDRSHQAFNHYEVGCFLMEGKAATCIYL